MTNDTQYVAKVTITVETATDVTTYELPRVTEISTHNEPVVDVRDIHHDGTVVHVSNERGSTFTVHMRAHRLEDVTDDGDDHYLRVTRVAKRAGFDPERDLPPDGARVTWDGCVFQFHASTGFWRVERAPMYSGKIGALSRPFSAEGIEVSRRWNEARSS